MSRLPARRRSCLKPKNEDADVETVDEDETVLLPPINFRKRVSFSHRDEIKEFINDSIEKSIEKSSSSIDDMNMDMTQQGLCANEVESVCIADMSMTMNNPADSTFVIPQSPPNIMSTTIVIESTENQNEENVNMSMTTLEPNVLNYETTTTTVCQKIDMSITHGEEVTSGARNFEDITFVVPDNRAFDMSMTILEPKSKFDHEVYKVQNVDNMSMTFGPNTTQKSTTFSVVDLSTTTIASTVDMSMTHREELTSGKRNVENITFAAPDYRVLDMSMTILEPKSTHDDGAYKNHQEGVDNMSMTFGPNTTRNGTTFSVIDLSTTTIADPVDMSLTIGAEAMAGRQQRQDRKLESLDKSKTVTGPGAQKRRHPLYETSFQYPFMAPQSIRPNNKPASTFIKSAYEPVHSKLNFYDMPDTQPTATTLIATEIKREISSPLDFTIKVNQQSRCVRESVPIQLEKAHKSNSVPVPGISAFGKFGSSKTPQRHLPADLFSSVKITESSEQKLSTEGKASSIINPAQVQSSVTSVVPNQVQIDQNLVSSTGTVNQIVSTSSFSSAAAPMLNTSGVLDLTVKTTLPIGENCSPSKVTFNCTTTIETEEQVSNMSESDLSMTIDDAYSQVPQPNLTSLIAGNIPTPQSILPIEPQSVQSQEYKKIPTQCVIFQMNNSCPIPPQSSSLLKRKIDARDHFDRTCLALPSHANMSLPVTDKQFKTDNIPIKSQPELKSYAGSSSSDLPSVRHEIAALKTVTGRDKVEALKELAVTLRLQNDSEFEMMINEMTGFIHPAFIQAELQYREYAKLMSFTECPTDPAHPVFTFTRKIMAQVFED